MWYCKPVMSEIFHLRTPTASLIDAVPSGAPAAHYSASGRVSVCYVFAFRATEIFVVGGGCPLEPSKHYGCCVSGMYTRTRRGSKGPKTQPPRPTHTTVCLHVSRLGILAAKLLRNIHR